MKLGIVVASEKALPSAFAVFRGFGDGIAKAAELGYDGVELAVRDGRDFRARDMQALLSAHRLEASAISTGQLFADKKLWLSARDATVRAAAVREFLSIIELAAGLGCLVNIGRARGFVEEGDTREETTARFTQSLSTVAEAAQKQGVTLVLEPVNRYETNYINSVDEGAELISHLEAAGTHGLKLMPDVFHMNIEDISIEGSLRRHGSRVGYVHVADSNRLAPGQGHLSFPAVFDALKEIGYDGWVTAETLPLPTPEEAARQTIAYLRGFYPRKKEETPA